MSAAVLERIKTPADLRKLTPDELQTLAGEMRDRIFSAVSNNGGHLASNLGVGLPERIDYRSRGAFVNLGQYKAVASMPGQKPPYQADSRIAGKAPTNGRLEPR